MTGAPTATIALPLATGTGSVVELRQVGSFGQSPAATLTLPD
ncbi:MAG TPA: hypothetical protein VNR91_04860 [Sphingomonas sp.]|nr:hypothetical protein [Sphingomonas sp.]